MTDKPLEGWLLEKVRDSSSGKEIDALQEQKVEDKKSDRQLKREYGRWFIYILIGQLLIMNGVFIAAGAEWLTFQKYELELYLGGTLAEVFGIVFIITKNLFPNKKQNGLNRKK